MSINFDALKTIYDRSPRVSSLKPINKEEYLIFRLAKDPEIAIFSPMKEMDLIARMEDMHDFFALDKVFWIIPVAIPGGDIIGFGLRGFNVKQYRIETKDKYNMQTLYGWQDFSDFTKGSPIVVTEGAKDRIAVSQFYKHSLSCFTVGMTYLTRQVISKLTKFIVLAYDNDVAGMRSFEEDSAAFSKLGCRCIPLRPTSCKDWAQGYLIESERSRLSAFLKNLND